MHYFAKLVFGGVYITPSKTFNRDVEVSVTKQEYDYLKTVTEKKVQTQGNGYIAVDIPRFEVRVEEPTKEEAILEQVADVPDTLGPRKPGRPKKED